MHAFLYPNKVVSTIPHPPRGWAPFLSRKELRSACFPFTSFRILAFLQKCYSQNPPADWLCKICPSNLLPFFYARSRESNMDSCRPVNAKRSHRLKNGVAIFADSKQSLRPLSFLSRTGNVLHAFHLQSFCILAFLKENIPLHSCNLQRLHRPENPSGFLPTYEPLLIPTCESKKDSHRQQT